MESEAAARYAELAVRMADEGRDELARTFENLARQEAGHLEALQRMTAGVELPAIDAGRYHWLDSGAPETAARELVLRLMTPRQALSIALHAERRARRFFEEIQWTTTDPALRVLAREMAEEEREHASLLAALLGSTPGPDLGGTLIFER
jgi:rubrerythrin